MKLIGSIVWGAILGAAAVLIHNAFIPIGLILALLGSGIGVWLVGRAWGLRRYKTLTGIAWILIVARGGSLGVGGEMLVQGNIAGNALVVAGFITIVLAVAAKA
jgi:hypothetical protein